ncbi:TPA: hypothetical protein KNN56_001696 [Clostridioides difficile]|uniref:yolD-like family protein n=1 Tax=Clostridioides difficile TaxID=1496 RepID=UPI00038CD436|nr:yolD-like family protein [Clostridioides difficile]EGT4625283.1 hypothetical protein [Clostridioides difficile]ELX4576075.1 hypothetical protein [Clostridioides difficile]EQK76168.1 yolD-like family protein [Clostridioides difficile CD113]MBH6986671.1 hypothetical protein [Clostridioides difficile]MBH7139408.1 hypothetical protein [Clostridioides difficile]
MNKKRVDIHCYDDIIKLPHHVSKVHPHMPIPDRAAQFAPFAALTGHDAAIKETARLTEERVELDENAKAVLDEKLRLVQEVLTENPELTVTYFQADEKKAGGTYLSVTGNVKKVDMYAQALLMADGLRIPLKDIYDLEGNLFGFVENLD